MRTLCPWACAIGVLGFAGAAWGAAPSDLLLLPEAKVPVIKRIKKAAPSPPPASPQGTALKVPSTPLPEGVLNPLRLMPWLPSGEMQLQQGASRYGGVAGQGMSTSRLGLSLRGSQGDTLWSFRSVADRQDQAWQLGEFSLVGHLGDRGFLTVGDEALSLGALLMDDLAIRGGGAHLQGRNWKGMAFAGRDRPAIASAERRRTLAGAQAETPLSERLVLRGRLLAQDDEDLAIRGGLTSVGAAYEDRGTRLEGDLAAALGGARADWGTRWSAEVPWDRLRFQGSYLRQGADFQPVRYQAFLREGGRENWNASLKADLSGEWQANATMGRGMLNLAGDAALPRQQSGFAVVGLAYQPRQGPGTNVSYSQSDTFTTSASTSYALRFDRLASELTFQLPFAQRSRARWEWWQSHFAGAPVQQHLLGLQESGLFGTALDWNEHVTLRGDAPTRLLHGLAWGGPLLDRRVQVRSGAFLEHLAAEPFASTSRVGLSLDLSTLLSESEQLSATGALEQSIGGMASARWLARYESRFGSPGERTPDERPARLGGRVFLPPGMVAGELRVLLDRVQVATVAPDGRFAFEDLAPGPHLVSLEVNRLPLALAIAPAQAVRAITLAKGQQLLDLRFDVQLARRLAGRVRDRQGRGVASLTVALEGEEARETWTDAEGRYAFEALPAGRYVVRLASPSVDGDYTWEEQTHVVSLKEQAARDDLDFGVSQKAAPLLKLGGALPADLFEAAEPRALPAPPPPVVFSPDPAVRGRPVTVRVRAIATAQQVWLRIAGAPPIPLRRVGKRDWQVTTRVPATLPAGACRVELQMSAPRGIKRLVSTLKLRP
ncbi:hypothetical protein D3C86_944080 [compost metagenome]